MKGASGQWARAASSRFRVPLALTPKSVCGSLAAQSWEGWAAVWTTSSILPACSAKMRVDRLGVADVGVLPAELGGLGSTSRSVTCEVEDSGPKKLARMSFSIPTTSKPSAMKCSTASEPIRPPAPVMIATGIRVYSLPFTGVRFRAPAAIRASSAAIHSWMSASTCSALRCGRHSSRPKSLAQSERYIGTSPGRVSATGAIGTSLPVSRWQISVVSQQREAALAAAADVHGAPVPGRRVEQLALDQVDQVLDVEQVAHLLALAAEADVAERVAEVVGEHPVGEDALVDLSHLPGAGDHPAAVDDGGEAEAGPVLLDQQLGGELGRPVEGAGALQRKLLARSRPGRRPAPSCSAAISKRVSASSRSSATCGATG